jgi:hypothetical protein
MDLYGHLMPEVNQRESERLDETVLGAEERSEYKLSTNFDQNGAYERILTRPFQTSSSVH